MTISNPLNPGASAESLAALSHASAPAESAAHPSSVSAPAPLSLAQLNASTQADFTRLLDGTYEHSPWIAAQAWHQRPFASLAGLKQALADVVRSADQAAQLALIRAHPELAGKAMVSNTLTAESTNEQGKAGLTDCTPAEFATLQQLNADYNAKFGFPFILAVRGPRGLGLPKAEIIATFARRLGDHPDFELAECLRNIHRIAEIRLNDKFGQSPELGNRVWDWAEQLSVHSDANDAGQARDSSGTRQANHSSNANETRQAGDARGSSQAGQADDASRAECRELTVTYLTPAHQACARQLMDWMRGECGFDEVSIDAVGNVVGLYHGSDHGGDSQAAPAQRLLTGSHYDTVRNGGKYDGRLGIFVPMACVRELHRQNRRLPFGLEVVAFAEEEGQRYKATFLGSGALTGQFDPAWLDQQDADGIPMREAMTQAGLRIDAIPGLKRDPKNYLGFVEVHIEQGPVLNALDLPLGVVTSINASVRYLGDITGMASHAGTTPMNQRRDAATAAAELALYVERRGASVPDLVATVGMLNVPGGSINVVPGRCQFSLDIRATTDAVRDACAADIRAELQAICQRRGLHFQLEETMRAAAAPSAPVWQQRWESAVQSLGLPVFQMPSGAGHDAMKLHEILPQAMLFVRGLNAGISHNPLESITSDDADLCVHAFQHLLDQLATEQTP